MTNYARQDPGVIVPYPVRYFAMLLVIGDFGKLMCLLNYVRDLFKILDFHIP